MRWGVLAGLLPCLLPSIAIAETLQVGPDKPYTRVSDALAAAAPGDVIEVDAGEYIDDVSTITTGDLTIRGVGETRSHLRATQPLFNDKGIFAIELNTGPIVVENIEFSGAFINAAGDNGAGIRMQGESLVVRNCYFHDNQNGILSGGTPDHTVRIENSEFAYNGNPGSGQEHNVYISGSVARFDFIGNYSHHTFSGHTLKTRARENHIFYNRFGDEDDGSSSYLIDISNGGLTYIVGNQIQQGPTAENTGTLVRYNAEGVSGPENRLFVVNNTLVNDNGSNPAFVRMNNGADGTAVFRNNLMVGNGTPFIDETEAMAITDEGNLLTDEPNFVDRAAYDYTLVDGSPAIDAGVDPGSDGAMSLEPTEVYAHPAQTVTRFDDLPLDIGAHAQGFVDPGTTGGETSGGDESTGDAPETSGDGTTGDAGDDTTGSSAGESASADSADSSEPTPGGGNVETDGDTDGTAADGGSSGCRVGPPAPISAVLVLLTLFGLRRRC
ncbi:MAG: right-handed parallel beta-helix repeat-containing protein [Myxococcota bacterium]